METTEASESRCHVRSLNREVLRIGTPEFVWAFGTFLHVRVRNRNALSKLFRQTYEVRKQDIEFWTVSIVKKGTNFCPNSLHFLLFFQMNSFFNFWMPVLVTFVLFQTSHHRGPNEWRLQIEPIHSASEVSATHWIEMWHYSCSQSCQGSAAANHADFTHVIPLCGWDQLPKNSFLCCIWSFGPLVNNGQQ